MLDTLTFLELSPINSFLTLSTAKKLLITNSTFTYWVAYISSFIYGNEGEVFAPNFVSRVIGYDKNKQFLPHWKVIKGYDCINSKF